MLAKKASKPRATPTVERNRLARYAQHIAELHRLVAAGLVGTDGGKLKFIRPDHPSVKAWRAVLTPPDLHTQLQAWLLYKAYQMVDEAKAAQRPAAIIEKAEAFARRVPAMSKVEVCEWLDYFIADETPAIRGN